MEPARAYDMRLIFAHIREAKRLLAARAPGWLDDDRRLDPLAYECDPRGDVGASRSRVEAEACNQIELWARGMQRLHRARMEASGG
jgi:hypothetical protein